MTREELLKEQEDFIAAKIEEVGAGLLADGVTVIANAEGKLETVANEVQYTPEVRQASIVVNLQSVPIPTMPSGDYFVEILSYVSGTVQAKNSCYVASQDVDSFTLSVPDRYSVGTLHYRVNLILV